MYCVGSCIQKHKNYFRYGVNVNVERSTKLIFFEGGCGDGEGGKSREKQGVNSK
jgi:hypothetical protein